MTTVLVKDTVAFTDVVLAAQLESAGAVVSCEQPAMPIATKIARGTQTLIRVPLRAALRTDAPASSDSPFDRRPLGTSGSRSVRRARAPRRFPKRIRS